MRRKKKKNNKIIIVKKNMKTSLKTGFAQIFSCCPPKMGGCRKFGGRRLQPPSPFWPVRPP